MEHLSCEYGYKEEYISWRMMSTKGIKRAECKDRAQLDPPSETLFIRSYPLSPPTLRNHGSHHPKTHQSAESALPWRKTMSIERVMQRILLALVAMAIAASAWGDEIGEAGRLPVGTVAAEEGETDALSDMLRSEELSLGLIVGALALALFLGAAHGLEPGHGKTIVAAYLVGARGTRGQCLFSWRCGRPHAYL